VLDEEEDHLQRASNRTSAAAAQCSRRDQVVTSRRAKGPVKPMSGLDSSMNLSSLSGCGRPSAPCEPRVRRGPRRAASHGPHVRPRTACVCLGRAMPQTRGHTSSRNGHCGSFGGCSFCQQVELMAMMWSGTSSHAGDPWCAG
jgi:hypothetical protein